MNELPRLTVKSEDVIPIYLSGTCRSERSVGGDCMDLFAEVVNKDADSIVPC